MISNSLSSLSASETHELELDIADSQGRLHRRGWTRIGESKIALLCRLERPERRAKPAQLGRAIGRPGNEIDLRLQHSSFWHPSVRTLRVEYRRQSAADPSVWKTS